MLRSMDTPFRSRNTGKASEPSGLGEAPSRDHRSSDGRRVASKVVGNRYRHRHQRRCASSQDPVSHDQSSLSRRAAIVSANHDRQGAGDRSHPKRISPQPSIRTSVAKPAERMTLSWPSFHKTNDGTSTRPLIAGNIRQTLAANCRSSTDFRQRDLRHGFGCRMGSPASLDETMSSLQPANKRCMVSPMCYMKK